MDETGHGCSLPLCWLHHRFHFASIGIFVIARTRAIRLVSLIILPHRDTLGRGPAGSPWPEEHVPTLEGCQAPQQPGAAGGTEPLPPPERLRGREERAAHTAPAPGERSCRLCEGAGA